MIAIFAVLLSFSLLSPDSIDINTATIDELLSLPGIGPVKAESIIEFRELYGNFVEISDLEYVPGIGPGTIARIEDLIFITPSGNTLTDTLHWLPETDVTEPLLTMYFLDIGQGDAILIEASGGETWLFDGGPNSETGIVPTVVTRLHALGIDTLDTVAYSHPHADHIGGLASVLRIFEVLRVIDPGMDYASYVYEDLLEAVMEEECPFSLFHENDVYNLSPFVSITVISMGTEEENLSVNENSAILLVTCGDFSCLLTGDMEEQGEMVLTPTAEPLTVLKVPHHGSNTSLFMPWLRIIRPQFAIIQVGRDNRFGHPSPAALEVYSYLDSEILRTDLHETIVVRTDGSAVSITYGTINRGI